MNGRVFQTNAEQSKEWQFQDTLNMLMVYVSTAFKSYLTRVFTQLKDSEVPKPTDPLDIEIKSHSRKGVMVVSKFKEMVLQENYKQYIMDTKSLSAMMQSLYNIVWV